MKVLIGYIFIIIFYSCQQKEHNRVETIDLTDGLAMENEKILLSEFSDSIEYVFLEANEECLIDKIEKILIDDSLVFLFNRKQCFIFNTSGKFEQSIGKVGRGPGEFLDIIDFTINADEKKIFVYDREQKKVIRYGYDGAFETEFTLESWPLRITSNRDEQLILVWVRPEYLLNDNFSFSSYNMEGELLGRSFNRAFEGADLSEPSTGLTRLNYYCDSLSYWEINLDTIYRVDRYGDPWPRYKIQYAKGKIDEKPGEIADNYFRYSYFIETDKHLWFLRGVYNNEIMHVIYNKETHAFVKPYFEHKDIELSLRTGFINNVDGGYPFLPYDALFDGRLYCTFYPFELRNLIGERIYEDIEILDKHRQEDLYERLLHPSPNENPVIMIVTSD